MPTTEQPAAARGARFAHASRRSASASLARRAQRPALIPLGAALVARERAIKVARPYRTPAAAMQEVRRQLRRFEGRGERGRDSLEREFERRREQVGRLLRRQRPAAPGGAGQPRASAP